MVGGGLVGGGLNFVVGGGGVVGGGFVADGAGIAGGAFVGGVVAAEPAPPGRVVPVAGWLVVALDTVDVVSVVVDDAGAPMSFESDPQAAISAIAIARTSGAGATNSRRLCPPVAVVISTPGRSN